MTERKTIGISAFFQHSFFSSGVGTCMFSLADALASLGHKVVLVNTAGLTEWYDDCAPLKDKYERRNLMQWDEKKYPLLDIFVDIDGFLIPKERRRIAKQCVIFVRKPPFLTEQESVVYPIPSPVKTLPHCDAVWTWDLFSQQDVRILELLSSRPVFQIPYTWSPNPTESHAGSLPSWAASTKQVDPTFPWIAHVAETNNSMATNATLPIVALSYAKTHGKDFQLSQVLVHNASAIESQAFFKDNVLAHCKREGLQMEFIGRQRIADWRLHPKSFVLHHCRFYTIKPMALDAVWNGIPIVHNSPWLAALGEGLERLYYKDNSITGAMAAMEAMNADWKEGKGYFAPDAVNRLRAKILEAVVPLAKQGAWDTAVAMNVPPLVVEDAPAVAASPPKPAKTTLRVGFSDMWQDANCTYNFWTLLLTEACRQLPTPIKVEGVAVTDANVNEPIDLLFFAPFGDVWTRVSADVPKIHITGENTPPKVGKNVYLNFGFAPTNPVTGVYRFPLWKQYIDWFGANQERLVNPRTLPLDAFHTKYKAADRKKFCAFIVTNPTNKVRNEAFQWLNQYKEVDSAGRLFNTMGNTIFTDKGGGGGGELLKHKFLQEYKFCFAYENNRKDGYVTEKILAAKAAGCVPLYWGAEDINDDFKDGFINCNSLASPHELIEAVRKVDDDDAEWERLVNTKAFDIDAVRDELARIAEMILRGILPPESLRGLPTRLGASTCEEAAKLAEARGDKAVTGTVEPQIAPAQVNLKSHNVPMLKTPLPTVAWNEKTLLVTCATQKFIPSLMKWLETTKPRLSNAVTARVYLGEDITDFSVNLLVTEYPMVDFQRLPTKTVSVPLFPDLWDPQHYAWKLWIYQQLVREEALANTLVWYMDSASVIVRWPTAWLKEASEKGICMLEDAEQKNDQWCHPLFRARLAMTPEELGAQQVVGGIMAFVAGSRSAWRCFTEAWVLGCQRDLIVGPKWAGQLPDGRPCGHRHDQSILSILRLRHKIAVQPLSTVYNHESLRRCNKAGAALYIHRGQYKEHTNFAPRIGEVHLINLARRPDRIKRFKENHEAWTKEVCLRPAFDGRALNMTPNLARLFAPNDFLWKKAITGCALSHLSLWAELANELPCCENYLILEDDVKFGKGWLEHWKLAAEEIPDDYDVLYLGGVLPPNRGVFQSVVEMVNPFWGRVMPNQIFGQKQPTNYFHFCNYSYIISRQGAQKILDEIQRRGGYYTSADHMVCNRNLDMKHYVLMPMVAGCYQDDDPKYQQSQFNNFNRVDGFDSDLWNNDDRFTQEEISQALLAVKEGPIPVQEALSEALLQMRTAPAVAVTTTAGSAGPKFYTVGSHGISKTALLEYSWLREMLGEGFETIETLAVDHEPLSTTPTFICMKPHFDEYLPVFQRYEALQRPFQVVHLSDEFGSDPIDWYGYTACKTVVRIYERKDIPESVKAKVLVLPLGPWRRAPGKREIFQRSTIWSFFGTRWLDREQRMMPLQMIGPNTCKFYDTWMDQSQLPAKDYSDILLSTMFVPCPRGQNVETFRFYEALEHGCVPILVREDDDNGWIANVTAHLPVVVFQSWDQAPLFMKSLLENPESFFKFYQTLMTAWQTWKTSLKAAVSARLAQQH